MSTPHEQVLRARLERVLTAGRRDQQRRRSSADRFPSTPPSPTHNRSRSKTSISLPQLPSPPNLPSSPKDLPLPLTPPLTPPPTPPPPHHRHHNQPSRPTPPPLNLQPDRDPPVSPTPFNARTASAQCRQIDGYVSFASVEGLGGPPLSGDDEPGPHDDHDHPRPRSSAGAAIGRIWKVFGV